MLCIIRCVFYTCINIIMYDRSYILCTFCCSIHCILYDISYILCIIDEVLYDVSVCDIYYMFYFISMHCRLDIICSILFIIYYIMYSIIHMWETFDWSWLHARSRSDRQAGRQASRQATYACGYILCA